ncbi:YqaE/Pmp3 family membrane protein [Chryseobacterium gleum]|nr:YqaE/Pmp3 family membrane protein [Chryseobacterium gleum]QQY34676.1 YqaE/Pmp3 family membrane protein [Chryseobacterium gleum]
MMLLAILLPFLSFIVRGKIFTGIICLILQITLIGWLPAAIWAALSLQNERADKRNEKLIKAMKQNKK